MSNLADTVRHINRQLKVLSEHPGYFGPLPCVELQVLRLLEVRAVACGAADRAKGVTPAYAAFLTREFPDSSPFSLRSRLTEEGSGRKTFSEVLSRFIKEETTQQDLEGAPSE